MLLKTYLTKINQMANTFLHNLIKTDDAFAHKSDDRYVFEDIDLHKKMT